jgi:hypothetical protein
LCRQGENPSLLADAPAQVGPPLQIHGVCCAPALVCKAYCAEAVWVTTGEASHVKFWCWKPNEPEPLVSKPRVGDEVHWFPATNFRVS